MFTNSSSWIQFIKCIKVFLEGLNCLKVLKSDKGSSYACDSKWELNICIYSFCCREVYPLVFMKPWFHWIVFPSKCSATRLTQFPFAGPLTSKKYSALKSQLLNPFPLNRENSILVHLCHGIFWLQISTVGSSSINSATLFQKAVQCIEGLDPKIKFLISLIDSIPGVIVVMP